MKSFAGINIEHKKIAITATVFLIVVEIIIYLVAAASSGLEYRVIIEDKEGHLLYETPGKHLSRFEELSFQNRYGPVENYIVRVVSQEKPFPFRAWLVASIGIPVGGVLILAFLIKGYLAIFENGEKRPEIHSRSKHSDISFSTKQSVIGWIGSLSLFHIGAVTLVFLIALWIIPNAISETTSKIIGFMEKHPFFSIALLLFMAGFLVWVVYLRYRLAREAVRYQFELARIRLELNALETSQDKRPQLPPDSSLSIVPGKIQDEERRDRNEMV